ncbi:hypothetical protein [Kineococcus sp. NPDC059986]|uniref:hypothetical protein n=1 Tax=Kineococcus sp. NPDC059986 TaxID=3155538 RepID=UPI00344E7E2C
MTLIAGGLPLDQLLADLATERPVFHSEADFQHSLAALIARARPDWRVRLEVPVRAERSTHVDVLVVDPRGPSATSIELKYFTSRLQAQVAGEEFHLKDHAATDLARLHFVRDVARLEATSTSTQNGVAIMLTNVAGLWREPSSAATTRDRAFRIHEGTRLEGELRWGDGDFPANDVVLSGRYPLGWRDFSDLGVPGGVFRSTAVEVGGSEPGAAAG